MGQNRQHRAAARARRRLATPSGSTPRTDDTGHSAQQTLALLVRNSTILTGGSVPRAVRRVLSGLEPSVVSETETLLVAELMARVSVAWEHGWQPEDLRHGAAVAAGRQGVLAAELITQQALLSGAHRSAPPAWRDQLDAIADDVGHPSATATRWRPVSDLVEQGVPEATAWTEVLNLRTTLAELPALPLLLPPPSRWTHQAAAPQQTAAPGHDRLLTRIRALLAKAEGTNHPAEAEAFTAKAQDLMSRHAIDEALLHSRSEVPVDVLTRRVHLASPYASTKVLLLAAVASANRSRAIYLREYAIASVVGAPLDVEQVELLFTSLLIQATRAMAAAGTPQAGSFDRSPTFRRSFLTAYADRIRERLAEADEEAVASYGAELVPVLRRQADAVDAELARQFPHTTTLSNGFLDARGWQAGREAADRAVLVAGRLGS